MQITEPTFLSNLITVDTLINGLVNLMIQSKFII